ncbi:MAG TPA: class I SAM-dependent methyltransferase [Ktedonobacterales bacterium]|nr:class I SAM-dependent methyltransferase [Ktedonobacterales bacterium]
MRPKPAFLGPQQASAFQYEAVARAYQFRPPYPDATFDIFVNLAMDMPKRILDIGCGTGLVARKLVGRVAHIDAIDISPAMIEQGKRLPQGDSPSISWIVGAVETAPLNPHYSLITAGDSLHWMDWATVMPRLATMLTPHGSLAILGVGQLSTPWDDQLLPIIQHYSTVSGYHPYDLVAELESRGLFRMSGRQTTAPVPFAQPLDEYIESFHGRASFVRERMGDAKASAFDIEVRALVSQYCTGSVTLQLVTEVVWGKPQPLQPGE